jgi:hypothetical protein
MVKIVKNIKRIDREKVFDITVEKDHHYILSNGLVSHNSGLKYAASTTTFLSKSKVRDDKTKSVLGNIITSHLVKSRITKEQTKIETKLYFDKGLDQYYGLVDIAEKEGVFKKVSTQYELPDGSKVFEKNIYDNPEKYIVPFLKEIDEAAKKVFNYGQADSIPNNSEKE